MRNSKQTVPLPEVDVSDNPKIPLSNALSLEDDEPWAEPVACEAGEDTDLQTRQQFMTDKREPWRKGRRFK